MVKKTKLTSQSMVKKSIPSGSRYIYLLSSLFVTYNLLSVVRFNAFFVISLSGQRGQFMYPHGY